MTRGRARDILIGVLVVAVFGLIIAVYLGYNQLSNDGSTITVLTQGLHVDLENQTANRVHNVALWCGAINAGREYDRIFVQRVTSGQFHYTGPVRYTLGDLPCTKIEAATALSTHLKP